MTLCITKERYHGIVIMYSIPGSAVHTCPGMGSILLCWFGSVIYASLS